MNPFADFLSSDCDFLFDLLRDLAGESRRVELVFYFFKVFNDSWNSAVLVSSLWKSTS